MKGGHTEGNRVTKNGYESCLDSWEGKHKKCVDNVIKRFPTFNQIDPNGRCKANGINKSKRQSHELSQWDIWALNAAYDGPLPQCQHPGEPHNPRRWICRLMSDLSGTELSLISVRGVDLNNPGLINDLSSRKFELFTLIFLDDVCFS